MGANTVFNFHLFSSLFERKSLEELGAFSFCFLKPLRYTFTLLILSSKIMLLNGFKLITYFFVLNITGYLYFTLFLLSYKIHVHLSFISIHMLYVVLLHYITPRFWLKKIRRKHLEYTPLYMKILSMNRFLRDLGPCSPSFTSVLALRVWSMD